MKAAPNREAYFWDKVDKRGPDECWNWKASILNSGYGRFRVGAKTVGAHRYIWNLLYGEIPVDGYICHHCDNKICVNPKHLYLGDVGTNHRDMLARNRAGRGKAKLTENEVRAIKGALKLTKLTQRTLARMFGVSRQVIYYISNNTTWVGV